MVVANSVASLTEIGESAGRSFLGAAECKKEGMGVAKCSSLFSPERGVDIEASGGVERVHRVGSGLHPGRHRPLLPVLSQGGGGHTGRGGRGGKGGLSSISGEGHGPLLARQRCG